jgi:hypothetical protein
MFYKDFRKKLAVDSWQLPVGSWQLAVGIYKNP